MGRTPSTTHRRDFCRALYLQPSDLKLGCAPNTDVLTSDLKLGCAPNKDVSPSDLKLGCASKNF